MYSFLFSDLLLYLFDCFPNICKEFKVVGLDRRIILK